MNCVWVAGADAVQSVSRKPPSCLPKSTPTVTCPHHWPTTTRP